MMERVWVQYQKAALCFAFESDLRVHIMNRWNYTGSLSTANSSNLTHPYAIIGT